MALSGTTASGIRYPVSTDTVTLHTDLQNMMTDVTSKTVGRDTASYVNDLGTTWLAKATGTASVGLMLTNTTPAGTSDRTYGIYTGTDGVLRASIYNSSYTLVQSNLEVLRNGIVRAPSATNANLTNAKDLVTKEFADTIAYTPNVRVYNNASNATVAATPEYLTFNTERWDTHGMHDTTTNTDRITVPTGWAGYYLCGANINFGDMASSAGVDGAYVAIVDNTSNTIALQQYEPAIVGGANTAANVTGLVYLDEGDYVRCQVSTTLAETIPAGSAANWYNHDFFATFVSK
jgi:hypothetical protein